MDVVQRNRLTRIVGGLLLAAGVFHIGLVWRDDLGLELPRIREVAAYSAVDRGVILSLAYDETDAAFFHFLRTVIPPEGKLLVPQGNVDRSSKFRDAPLLEYYLFPIEIVLCAEPGICLGSADSEALYVLDVNGYPPTDWSDRQDSHLLETFGEGLGVYVPESLDGDEQ